MQVDTRACRTAVPLYRRGRQVGKATSTTWSPILKQMIALATLETDAADLGTELQMEWTIESVRKTIRTRVVPRPFFDPPRKRA